MNYQYLVGSTVYATVQTKHQFTKVGSAIVKIRYSVLDIPWTVFVTYLSGQKTFQLLKAVSAQLVEWNLIVLCKCCFPTKLLSYKELNEIPL